MGMVTSTMKLYTLIKFYLLQNEVYSAWLMKCDSSDSLEGTQSKITIDRDGGQGQSWVGVGAGGVDFGG